MSHAMRSHLSKILSGERPCKFRSGRALPLSDPLESEVMGYVPKRGSYI